MIAIGEAGGRPFKHQVRSALGWSVAQAWGAQLANLIVFAVLARLLRPETFGLIALAAVFVSLVKSFVDQGLSTAIVQRQSLQPDHLDAVFWLSVVIGGMFSLLGVLFANPIAALFSEPQLAQVIRWLSVVFIIDALSTVQQAVLRRRFAFRSLALRSLVSIVLGGAVGIWLALRGWGVMSLVMQQIVTAASGLILLWGVEQWRPQLRFSPVHAKELLGFGYNILGIRFATFAARRSDDVLIGYFLGTTALGYYTIAYKIYKVLLDLLAVVVARVALPAFAALQTDAIRFQDALGASVRAIGLVAFPAFIGMAVLATDLIPVVFGDAWVPSASVMRWLALAGIAQALMILFQQAFIAFGRPDRAFKVTLASAILMVAVFAGVVHFGIVAVAAGFAFVGLLFVPIQVEMMRRMIGFGARQLLASCKTPAIGTCVMGAAAVAWLLLSNGFDIKIRLFVGIGVCFSSYLAAVLIADPTVIRQFLFMVRARPAGAPLRPP